MEQASHTINLVALESALEGLRQAIPLGPNHPFAHCRSIRVQRIPGVEFAIASDYQIFQYLVRTISAALKHQRERSNLNGSVSKIGKNDPYLELIQDFRFENRELEAWSVLYHRYVQVEMDLSLEQIASLVGMPLRTLQRRQQLGLKRLLKILIQHEMQALESKRLANLRSSLPLSVAPDLYGRDDVLAWATDYLLNAVPAFLCLSGAPGVGKTTLALCVAHWVIQYGFLDSVVWINNLVPNFNELVRNLADKLGLPLDLSVVQAYLAEHKVLVVLDHLSLIPLDQSFAENSCRLLGNSRVLVVTNQLPMYLPNFGNLALTPLDQDTALEWLFNQMFVSSTREEEFAIKVRSGFAQTSGNLKTLRDQILFSVPSTSSAYI